MKPTPPSATDFEYVLIQLSANVRGKDKKFLTSHVQEIALELLAFGSYLNQVISTVVKQPKASIAVLQTQLHELQFQSTIHAKQKPFQLNKSEAKQVVTIIRQIWKPSSKGQTGGFLFFLNMDAYNDYETSLDLIYVLLFVMASIPFFGLFPNIWIVIRALYDGKTFLAILNTLTTMLSLFEFHMFDMGAIMKLIYLLDVHTVTKYVNPVKGIQAKGGPSIWSTLSSLITLLAANVAQQQTARLQTQIASKIPSQSLARNASSSVLRNTIRNQDKTQNPSSGK